MHTHTYEYRLTTPVPDSTPPEHQPNTDLPSRSTTRPRAVARTAVADVAPLDAVLAELELKREAQLASLRDATGDLVAIAYRDSVARILAEIRRARQRLREGTYGLCVDCHGDVPAERLEALPWATQCTDCARRRYA